VNPDNFITFDDLSKEQRQVYDVIKKGYKEEFEERKKKLKEKYEEGDLRVSCKPQKRSSIQYYSSSSPLLHASI
jgi:hypothetical protein